jgi:hypothetical protein
MKSFITLALALIICSLLASITKANEWHSVDANGMTLAAVSGVGDGDEHNDQELVKKLNNPVSALISVPFQNNFEFNLGPNDDGFKYTLNFQPVIPFSLNKDWNLITRTIVPFIHQSDVIPETSQTGLGDITQSFFFSPKQKVADLTVGAGPVFLYPASTNDHLGSEKWGIGPTVVLVKQQGPWSTGMLFNHIWSFAGDDQRHYISSTFIQPFLSYATKTKTTFSINAESTYDWHNRQWTVPVNLSVAQLTRIGKQPIQFTLGAKIYAEGPSGAPEWGIRFTVTPLFPVGARPPHVPLSSLTK